MDSLNKSRLESLGRSKGGQGGVSLKDGIEHTGDGAGERAGWRAAALASSATVPTKDAKGIITEKGSTEKGSVKHTKDGLEEVKAGASLGQGICNTGNTGNEAHSIRGYSTQISDSMTSDSPSPDTEPATYADCSVTTV